MSQKKTTMFLGDTELVPSTTADQVIVESDDGNTTLDVVIDNLGKSVSDGKTLVYLSKFGLKVIHRQKFNRHKLNYKDTVV